MQGKTGRGVGSFGEEMSSGFSSPRRLRACDLCVSR